MVYETLDLFGIEEAIPEPPPTKTTAKIMFTDYLQGECKNPNPPGGCGIVLTGRASGQVRPPHHPQQKVIDSQDAVKQKIYNRLIALHKVTDLKKKFPLCAGCIHLKENFCNLNRKREFKEVNTCRFLQYTPEKKEELDFIAVQKIILLDRYDEVSGHIKFIFTDEGRYNNED